MVELRRLSHRFGDVTAVDSLSFTVDEGQVFGLLGPNGTGKTTTSECSAASSRDPLARRVSRV